jgi:cytochrome c peroxidase
MGAWRWHGGCLWSGMRHQAVAAAFFAAIAAVALFASLRSAATEPLSPQPSPRAAFTKAGVTALGPRKAHDGALVALGRALYHDARLSRTRDVSCATCHPLHEGGTTREPLTRLGVSRAPANFNTPSTFNATLSERQGWRLDAKDIPELLERPFFDDSCMGNRGWAALLAQVAARHGRGFARARLAVDKDGVNAALVAYMQSIEPRGAPFDVWLRGEDAALDDEARRGADLFVRVGCIACHDGPGLGGARLTRFGLAVADPYEGRGVCVDGGYCRQDEDRAGSACARPAPLRDVDLGTPTDGPPSFLFRVPSLRNVALTAPYLHDGSARTLDEAVRVMARVQLGRELSATETRELVAFMHALTGALPDGELALAAHSQQKDGRIR